ncbi:hypothetical protein E4U43_003082 [Claviceps pusilla]|uniref:Uncharacterized protein n=1 Tax=Claviceps pusilla TaxID=123648 RepID=A0A9P7NI37_9HYPO|nr:hypothetical protein E4U43_003082 [Claviceps pusilla]
MLHSRSTIASLFADKWILVRFVYDSSPPTTGLVSAVNRREGIMSYWGNQLRRAQRLVDDAYRVSFRTMSLRGIQRCATLRSKPGGLVGRWQNGLPHPRTLVFILTRMWAVGTTRFGAVESLQLTEPPCPFSPISSLVRAQVTSPMGFSFGLKTPDAWTIGNRRRGKSLDRGNLTRRPYGPGSLADGIMKEEESRDDRHAAVVKDGSELQEAES